MHCPEGRRCFVGGFLRAVALVEHVLVLVLVEEVEEELGVELPRGEYDTLGGFISHLLGHVPAQGESSRHSDLLFTVQEADPRKVSLIKVSHVTEGD